MLLVPKPLITRILCSVTRNKNKNDLNNATTREFKVKVNISDFLNSETNIYAVREKYN